MADEKKKKKKKKTTKPTITECELGYAGTFKGEPIYEPTVEPIAEEPEIAEPITEHKVVKGTLVVNKIIDKTAEIVKAAKNDAVVCCMCGAYVERKDAILAGDKYVCSKKCLRRFAIARPRF